VYPAVCVNRYAGDINPRIEAVEPGDGLLRSSPQCRRIADIRNSKRSLITSGCKIGQIRANAASLRETRNTLAPASAAWRAVAKPMPEEAPVMTIV
jgi:hypothetical protein